MVICNCIEQMFLTSLLEFLHEWFNPCWISLSKCKCVNMSIWNYATKNLCRTNSKISSLLDGIAGSLAIRLIPDTPILYNSLIMLSHFAHPTIPCLKSFLRRREACVEMTSTATFVTRITITELHPHLHAHLLSIKYTCIKPSKIIHSRVLLNPCPTCLLTDTGNTEWRHITTHCAPVCMLAIHTATVKSPAT